MTFTKRNGIIYLNKFTKRNEQDDDFKTISHTTTNRLKNGSLTFFKGELIRYMIMPQLNNSYSSSENPRVSPRTSAELSLLPLSSLKDREMKDEAQGR